MDNELVNYFTSIDKNAYQDIISYISNSNVEVTFKIYDLYTKSSFIKVDGAELAIFKKYPYDYETAYVLCSFLCGGEPHFFRAKMTTSDKYYLLNYPEKIYKIQRRANFRFNVPVGLSHEFKILDQPSFKCELRDISLGGCKVAVRTTTELNFPLESDIRIWIKLLEFGDVTLDATVAFTRFFQSNNSQIIGIKFGQIEANLLSDLHQTLIQVDRLSRSKPDETI